ncbi:MAG: twin-arginine translocase TatA/TatE family subunit [Rhizomicrobium sp.]|jgi:sec-independent protein translocase protein TatA
MGTFGPLHWLLLAAVALVLFGGRGKISDLMGDFAKGIKSFKKGLADEEVPPKVVSPDRRDETPTSQKDTATHS